MKNSKGFTPLEVRGHQKKHKKNKLLTGFTIIELIITIFILSVAVVGVYNAFSTMVVLTATASDRLTAAYLAQEGMEVVRNIRDTNWLEMAAGDPSVDWDTGLRDCGSDVGGCKADYKTTGTTGHALTPYGGDSADYLRIDTDGFYSYSTGTNTKFKRKIIITPPGSPNDYIMYVSVQVFWDEKASILNPAGQGSIIVEENLYNWY